MNIFLHIIGGVFLLIFFILIWKEMKIKYEISDWQIDDVLIIKNNPKLAKLKGWNKKEVVVSFDGDNYHGVLKMRDVQGNKSAYWRRIYNDCEKTMGMKPKFNHIVTFWYRENEQYSEGSIKVHGKAIDLLTETECQIYLKECLEREEYEIAELIKKRMDKFR